jgi:hypothetical protein
MWTASWANLPSKSKQRSACTALGRGINTPAQCYRKRPTEIQIGKDRGCAPVSRETSQRLSSDGRVTS